MILKIRTRNYVLSGYRFTPERVNFNWKKNNELNGTVGNPNIN